MIRTTFKASEIRMACWIAAIAALGAVAPAWATEDAFTMQDITKFVRDAGPGE